MKPIRELNRAVWKVVAAGKTGPAAARNRITGKVLYQSSPLNAPIVLPTPAPISQMAFSSVPSSVVLWGFDDLAWVINHWGQPDQSGIVDMDDLLFVLARWGTPKEGHADPFIVTPPQPTVIIDSSINGTHGVWLNGRHDTKFIPMFGDVSTKAHIILCDNNCQRCIIDFQGQEIINIPSYFAFLNGVNDVTIRNGIMRQKAGANQAMARHHSCFRTKYENVEFYNDLALNDIFRVSDGSQVWCHLCDFTGGRLNHGWNPGVDGGSSGNCETWYTGCAFHHHQPGGPGYSKQINVYPGCKAVHLWDCDGYGSIDGDTSVVDIQD